MTKYSILEEKDLNRVQDAYHKLCKKLRSLDGLEDDWSEALRLEGEKLREKIAAYGVTLLRQEAVVYLDEFLNGKGEEH